MSRGDPQVLTEPEPETVALPVPPGPDAQTARFGSVAPQPIAPPPPEAKPDDIETPPVSLDEGAETQQEQQDQTAPEEAAPEIVTEAEESGGAMAPLTSPRPRVRPNRPSPPQANLKWLSTPEPAPASRTERVRGQGCLGRGVGWWQENPLRSAPDQWGKGRHALGGFEMLERRIAFHGCAATWLSLLGSR